MVVVLETGVAVDAVGVAATGVGLIVGATWGAVDVVAATGVGAVGAGVSGEVTGVVTGGVAGVDTGAATVGGDAAGTDAGAAGSGVGVGRCGCGATLQAIKKVKKSRLRIAEKSCCMPVRSTSRAPLAFCYGTRVNALSVLCIVKRWCIPETSALFGGQVL